MDFITTLTGYVVFNNVLHEMIVFCLMKRKVCIQQSCAWSFSNFSACSQPSNLLIKLHNPWLVSSQSFRVYSFLVRPTELKNHYLLIHPVSVLMLTDNQKSWHGYFLECSYLCNRYFLLLFLNFAINSETESLSLPPHVFWFQTSLIGLIVGCCFQIPSGVLLFSDPWQPFVTAHCCLWSHCFRFQCLQCSLSIAFHHTRVLYVMMHLTSIVYFFDKGLHFQPNMCRTGIFLFSSSLLRS